MVSLIIGAKGSGKTKKLIEKVNSAASVSTGNVVCVEKGRKLTYDLSNQVRLIDTDSYGISGFDQFYGFLAGVCAGNYDITDIFVDATLRIGSRDFGELETFLSKVEKISTESDTRINFTISADEADLPAGIFEFCKKL